MNRSHRSVSVSVVMPVGEVDGFLPRQLDALANQDSTEDWELVVSLNTSDPVARERLVGLLDARSQLRSRIVDSSELRSASHARNVGAREAAGRRLLFCDGDDVADPGWIAAMVEALNRGGAVGGHLEENLLAIAGQEHWRPPATPEDLPRLLGSPYLVTANMGLDRATFEAGGGFDVSLLRGEDIAFSWDLLDREVELHYAPGAVMHYRHRQGLMAMMHQHYLYGRGMSQILARRGVPGQAGPAARLAAMRPNAQPVSHKGVPYYLRRGSIAVGRLVGLVGAYRPTRRGGRHREQPAAPTPAQPGSQ